MANVRARLSPGLTTETVDTVEGLTRLLPQWWALWDRCPSATPFQSPAWLLPWWRAFQPGELLVVAVRQHGRLVGLGPFYIENGLLGRRVLPLGLGVSDYLDVLIDPQASDEAAAALVDHITAQADRWDSWELEEIAPHAATWALPCCTDLFETVDPQSACPVLALPCAAERLSAMIPKRSLRKAWNRVQRRAGIDVVEATFANVQDLINALIDLHRQRWTARYEPGVLGTQEVQRFHVEAAPRLLAAEMLRLCGLRIQGRFVGVYYGFAHRGRAYGYLSGFDPGSASERPGTVLLAHAIHEAARAGCREFHFLRGQEPYKYAWGATDRWNQRRSLRRADRTDVAKLRSARQAPTELSGFSSTVGHGHG
jgi:CelD/BcsL family acetyltransferase involved in cellulose biosynthesis